MQQVEHTFSWEYHFHIPIHSHKAQTRLPPTDQSENTKVLASSLAKIDAETIDQSIPAMLRLIVDDLAFTLYSFTDSFLDYVSGNKGIIIVFLANPR